MITIKKFEDFKTVHSKDLDTWSVEVNDKNKGKIRQSMNVDMNLVNRVTEILDNYGLKINLSSGNHRFEYLNKQGLLLPKEKQLCEYRFQFYKEIDDWDDEQFREDEGLTEDDRYRELDSCEFSVFLPVKQKDLENMGVVEASNYLKMLDDTIKEVYTMNIGEYYDALTNYRSNFKKFINFNNIKINNDNFDIVVDLSHRLYRDGKFFFNLQGELGERTYEKFIHDWLNVI